jgi:hypothetical protein
MEPTSAPQPQPQTPPTSAALAPATDPGAVTPGVPVGWGAPPTPESLPDDDTGRKRITLAILVVLIITALTITVSTFAPWKKSTTPGGVGLPSVSLLQIDTQMHEADTLVNELDANMVGVDPSLSDVQGDLTE